MSQLTCSDFVTFFEEVWDRKPYRWQQELLRQVAESETGKWPDVIDMPTGSGKTSILDVGLFALALDAQRPPEARRMPRRIVLVVDRRVVVDQAGFRGQILFDKIVAAEGPIAQAVRHLLRSLSADGDSDDGDSRTHPPFNVGVLRGGIVRDESWAERPDRPALLTSTVDQVGSRLLFQGYGLSRSARPIHAGLLGVDTLIVLDEVQVAIPFAETLETLYSFDRSRNGVPSRWQVVEMSATARAREGDHTVFPSVDQRADLLSDTEIVRRTAASKLITLLPPVTVPANQLKANEVFSKAVANEILGLLSNSCSTVAAIVNRVDTARRVANQLDQTARSQGHIGSVKLITGRMRPLDRDKAIDEGTRARLCDRIDRTEGDQPLIIVSTQTLEAGADYDFDAIVTECASADSLVQRFGRLDRSGKVSANHGHSFGRILVRSTSLTEMDDPVYQQAIGTTWNWINQNSINGQIDFGISAFPPRPTWPTGDESVTVNPDVAPLLFPEHLDLWHQTNPAPALLPDAAQWLHGIRPVRPEVQVVWRADLEGLLNQQTSGEGLEADNLITEIFSAMPPLAIEALTLPIFELRNFLRHDGDAYELADLDAAFETSETDEAARTEPPTPFVRWADKQAKFSRNPADVRPGDVIVLASSAGGIGFQGNWDPASKETVDDLAETARTKTNRPAILRIDPSVGGRSWLTEFPLVLPTDQQLDEPSLAEIRETLEGWKASLPADVVSQDPTLNAMKMETCEIRRLTNGRVWIVESKVELESPGEDETDEPSFTKVAKEVTLDSHLSGVGAWARKLATNVCLPVELIEDLELAGHLHDLGKADPRFQSWLRNGSPATTDLIAKSALASGDQRQRMAARAVSGYPKGTRHELMSLALIENDEALRSRAHDWELVCHLVASHHGHCRPFAPTSIDRNPLVVGVSSAGVGHTLSAPSNHGFAEASSEVAQRFWALSRRFGWHGLAYLEALLRLADHRRSAWESEQQSTQKGNK
jgi:CRISPR-associated endonuclease/helicase Cas3